MGMFDSVSSALDTASQMLAGGTNDPASAAKDTKPTFLRGENLDTNMAVDGGPRAPNLLNAHNAYPLIEFIHFGNVHSSFANLFAHADYADDTKEDKIKAGDRPRGIQFRSALEREAILLSTFMECTQTVLDERDKSGGALGALGGALNTLGSLAGTGSGDSGPAKASDVNTHIQKVVSAAAPILPDAITYINTHKAGIDFHQARANYRTFLQGIVDEAPKADPVGGMMGKLTSAVGGGTGVVGELSTVINFTQGVAFKPQDIKVKFFVLVAQQTEPQIETACNAMTLKAIKDLINPVLPVWMRQGPAAGNTPWTPPDDPLAGDHGNLLNPLLNPVTKEADKGIAEVGKEGNKVKSFFETPPDDPAPGADALGIAFTDPPAAGGDKTIVPMAMGAVAPLAFKKALGITSSLGIPETVVSAVVGVALEFTQAAYASILVRDENTPITHDAVLAAGRDDLQIGKRLEALAVSHLSFLKTIKDFKTPSVAGFQVQPGDLIDKEIGDLDSLIANKLKPVLDPAIEYAMGALADQLELARQNGMNNTSHAMEWYLGRLPWVQATLFCNLFFPFWNALMRCASEIVDKGTGSVLKGILNAADKVKGVVDTGRDALAKAAALKAAADNTISKLGSGVNLLDPTKIADLGSGYSDATKKKAAKTTGPTLDQGKFVIPVTGRSEKGTGQAIKKADLDTVKQQWNGADDPIKDDDADDSAAAADAGSGSTAANADSAAAK